MLGTLVDICALKKPRPTNSVHHTSGCGTMKWPPVEYGNCNKNLKRVEQKSVPTIIRTSTRANFMLPILSATIRCKKGVRYDGKVLFKPARLFSADDDDDRGGSLNDHITTGLAPPSQK